MHIPEARAQRTECHQVTQPKTRLEGLRRYLQRAACCYPLLRSEQQAVLKEDDMSGLNDNPVASSLITVTNEHRVSSTAPSLQQHFFDNGDSNKGKATTTTTTTVTMARNAVTAMQASPLQRRKEGVDGDHDEHNAVAMTKARL